MGSIVGEKKKWHNAISDDIAAIDQQISETTVLLNAALADIAWAKQSLTSCGSLKFLQTCKGQTGRTLAQWNDLLTRNMQPVVTYTATIKRLQEQRAQLVSNMEASAQAATETAQSQIIQSEANTAIAKADIETSGATIAKVGTYALIGGVIIAVIIGGIFIYKKVKKH
jgi:hypothetical protein